MSELKQALLLRVDLKMSKGKAAAQAAHAAVEAVLKSDKKLLSQWRSQGMKKVTLSVNTKDEIYKLLQQAKDAGLNTALITDAGKTEIAAGSVTALAIGPDLERNIDNITKDLKVY